MKPDRISRKLGSDTLQNMIYKTEHNRTHAKLEAINRVI
jgi:hypothetical protein